MNNRLTKSNDNLKTNQQQEYREILENQFKLQN